MFKVSGLCPKVGNESHLTEFETVSRRLEPALRKALLETTVFADAISSGAVTQAELQGLIILYAKVTCYDVSDRNSVSYPQTDFYDTSLLCAVITSYVISEQLASTLDHAISNQRVGQYLNSLPLKVLPNLILCGSVGTVFVHQGVKNAEPV